MHRLFQRSSKSLSYRSIAAGLAWTVIWVGTLGYSPGAHESLHHDAHQADHHCAVDTFSAGVLLGDLTPTIKAPESLILPVAEAVPASPNVPATRRTPPGRAPPIG